MSKFKFTEGERDKIESEIDNFALIGEVSVKSTQCVIDRIEQIISERGETISPVPTYGNSVASTSTAPSDQGDAEAWELVESVIGRCTCNSAYVSRQMTDPHCLWCDYHVDLITAMRQFAANEVDKARKEEYDYHESKRAKMLRVVQNFRKRNEELKSQLSAANQRVAELEEQNKKYWFMIEHGLGVEDMAPPTYPHP